MKVDKNGFGENLCFCSLDNNEGCDTVMDDDDGKVAGVIAVTVNDSVTVGFVNSVELLDGTSSLLFHVSTSEAHCFVFSLSSVSESK